MRPTPHPAPGTSPDHISRRQFVQQSGWLAVSVAMIGPLAACGTSVDDTLSRAQRQGFIRVGFANEAPYGHIGEGGKLTGVGPELARVVFGELGVPEIDGVLSPFGALIDRLHLGAFDVIVAGMFITPDRCRRVLFSDPHFCIEQAFLVERGNPHEIHTYEDISQDPALVLGVVTGAVEVEQAVAAGVPQQQIVRVDGTHELLGSLQAGTIDAGALSTVSLARLAQINTLNGFEVTEPFTYHGQPGCGAFAFRQEDTRLRDEFNHILNRLRADRSVNHLLETFGFVEADAAATGVTAQHLCRS